MPTYTIEQIADQISEPLSFKYKSRGKEINPKNPGDFNEISRYFRDDESFYLVLDHKSCLFSFIKNKGIEELREDFLQWIWDTTKRHEFSVDSDINSITRYYFSSYISSRRAHNFESTPILVASSKTKCWIGYPNDKSGPFLIDMKQGLPMVISHIKDILNLPCFFWSKTISPRSSNSWIQPFSSSGYTHPPNNLQWVLYREFIYTYASKKSKLGAINTRQLGDGDYGSYF